MNMDIKWKKLNTPQYPGLYLVTLRLVRNIETVAEYDGYGWNHQSRGRISPSIITKWAELPETYNIIPTKNL